MRGRLELCELVCGLLLSEFECFRAVFCGKQSGKGHYIQGVELTDSFIDVCKLLELQIYIGFLRIVLEVLKYLMQY
ncbi:hypothetical protein HanRHA438_Chr03g0116911 [Helianthus annuus]|nr:hypothetical protein HanRHA438_Chr03g0116911 [Helianthus annuus]